MANKTYKLSQRPELFYTAGGKGKSSSQYYNLIKSAEASGVIFKESPDFGGTNVITGNPLPNAGFNGSEKVIWIPENILPGDLPQFKKAVAHELYHFKIEFPYLDPDDKQRAEHIDGYFRDLAVKSGSKRKFQDRMLDLEISCEEFAIAVEGEMFKSGIIQQKAKMLGLSKEGYDVKWSSYYDNLHLEANPKVQPRLNYILPRRSRPFFQPPGNDLLKRQQDDLHRRLQQDQQNRTNDMLRRQREDLQRRTNDMLRRNNEEQLKRTSDMLRKQREDSQRLLDRQRQDNLRKQMERNRQSYSAIGTRNYGINPNRNNIYIQHQPWKPTPNPWKNPVKITNPGGLFPTRIQTWTATEGVITGFRH